MSQQPCIVCKRLGKTTCHYNPSRLSPNDAKNPRPAEISLTTQQQMTRTLQSSTMNTGPKLALRPIQTLAPSSAIGPQVAFKVAERVVVERPPQMVYYPILPVYKVVYEPVYEVDTPLRVSQFINEHPL